MLDICTMLLDLLDPRYLQFYICRFLSVYFLKNINTQIKVNSVKSVWGGGGDGDCYYYFY